MTLTGKNYFGSGVVIFLILLLLIEILHCNIIPVSDKKRQKRYCPTLSNNTVTNSLLVNCLKARCLDNGFRMPYGSYYVFYHHVTNKFLIPTACRDALLLWFLHGYRVWETISCLAFVQQKQTNWIWVGLQSKLQQQC